MSERAAAKPFGQIAAAQTAGSVESGPQAQPKLRALDGLGALLGVRGFLRLCVGTGIALSGQRLQNIALAWLVLEMTGSKLWLGVVVGVPSLVAITGSLSGGVLADSPRAAGALKGTRLAMAAAAFAAGLLVTTGHVEVGLLRGVAMVTAFATAVDMPVSRTLIFDMAGRERALAGTSLNSLAMNLCAVGGPLAVGGLIGRFGVDTALYGIAAAYAVSALLMPPIQRHTTESAVSPLRDLRAGFAYLRETPCVAWLVGLFFRVPVAGVFFAMVPVYAHEVLDVGPSGLGVLMATYGAGTVAGSAYLVVNGEIRRRGLVVTAVGVLFGAGVIAFAVSRSLVLSSVVGFGIGVTAMLWQNTLSAMVQTAAAPEMKGRAMSVGTMG